MPKPAKHLLKDLARADPKGAAGQCSSPRPQTRQIHHGGSLIPKTVGEALYWSYANFADGMHLHPECRIATTGSSTTLFASKTYYSLLRGKRSNSGRFC